MAKEALSKVGKNKNTKTKDGLFVILALHTKIFSVIKVSNSIKEALKKEKVSQHKTTQKLQRASTSFDRFLLGNLLSFCFLGEASAFDPLTTLLLLCFGFSRFNIMMVVSEKSRVNDARVSLRKGAEALAGGCFLLRLLFHQRPLWFRSMK